MPGPRAIFGGPLEFNAAAVDLRITMDGLTTWFSEHATKIASEPSTIRGWSLACWTMQGWSVRTSVD